MNKYKNLDERIIKDQMTITIQANKPNSILATALKIGMLRAHK